MNFPNPVTPLSTSADFLEGPLGGPPPLGGLFGGPPPPPPPPPLTPVKV